LYSPSPFLITTGALTSIFSFFFGEYFKIREEIYRLWIRVIAYDFKDFSEDELKVICSELESKERMFRQAKGFFWIILISLLSGFIVFQFYSFKYFDSSSPFYQEDAFHIYIWFTIIIGILILINIIEILYIWFAIEKTMTFPYFKFRLRVTGQERLSMIWRVLDCSCKKRPEFDGHRIPKIFYRDREKNKKIF
jgi:hypothetical protein